MVVSQTQKLCTEGSGIGLAYIYCSFKRQSEQDIRSILLSIVKQLLQRLSKPVIEVENLFDTCKRDGTEPSDDQAWGCLIALTREFKRTVVIVDAIDEYQSDRGQRQKLLDYILRLPQESSTNVFATSRHIPEIKSVFQNNGCLSLDIEADDDDVRKCLAKRMVELPSFVLRDRNLQESIITTIVKAAGGMFLISELYQKSLIGARSPKTLRKQLERFPSGSDAYDFAYGEAMHRIESQNRNTRDLAKQALTWIVAAAEPLPVQDLLVALAIEVGEDEFDADNVSDITDVVSACAGLLTIEETSNIIRLVHYTTQEYLQRTINDWSPHSNADLAASCVSCLLYDTVPQIEKLTEEGDLLVVPRTSFVGFCERNWGSQAQLASAKGEYPALDNLVSLYLSDRGRMLHHNEQISAFQGLSIEPYDPETYQPLLTGMHIAAQYNLVSILQIFVDRGELVDDCGEDGVTSLFVASAKGSAESVSFLLQNNANFEARTSEGYTPLIIAFSKGDKKTIEILLQHCGDFKSHQENTYGWTVMRAAATVGDPKMVELALHYGADPDVRDLEGQTPLMIACEKGWAGTACRLIEGGADVNAKRTEGQYVLDCLFTFSSSDKMYKARLAEYIFSRGGVFSEDDSVSALDRAFDFPATTVIKKWLEQKADTDTENEDGLTLLMHCIKCSFFGLYYDKSLKDEPDRQAQEKQLGGDAMMFRNIELLLLSGANPNKGDSSGMLPLLLVLSCDTSKAQKKEKAGLLLRAGADPDLKYGNYSTPRESAAWYGFKIEGNALVEIESATK